MVGCFGFLRVDYLASVLDLASRQVVGWSLSTAFYPVPQKTLGILQKINPVFAKTKK
jgi:transposase InsO family protein